MKAILVTLALAGLFSSAWARSRNVTSTTINPCAGVPPTSVFNIPDLFDCTRFTMCIGEQAISRTCAPGLHFSQIINDCDLIANANCVPQSPPPDQVNPCAGVPPTQTINIGDPFDCTRFTTCIGDTPVLRTCPEGFHFSQAVGDCDFIANANCVPQGGGPQPTPPPGNVEAASCDLNTNMEIIASMESCQHYTICACGHGHLRQCSAGLTFDSRTSQCSSTGVCISDPAAMPTCPNGFVGNMGHPNDCQHYFLCFGNPQPMLRRCAPGLAFNRTTNRCELVGAAQCTV